MFFINHNACIKYLQNWGFSLHDRLHSWYPEACFVIWFLNAIWLFWSGYHDGFFPWLAWSPQRQLVPAMLNTEKYASIQMYYCIADTSYKLDLEINLDMHTKELNTMACNCSYKRSLVFIQYMIFCIWKHFFKRLFPQYWLQKVYISKARSWKQSKNTH